MIEATLYSGEKFRVEAARVVLPGFEWAEVFATPRLTEVDGCRTEPEEERWVITDALTGARIGREEETGRTIEEAVYNAAMYLQRWGVTEEIYRQKQRWALKETEKRKSA